MPVLLIRYWSAPSDDERLLSHATTGRVSLQWAASGWVRGVRPGFSYGATDEFGYKAQQEVCTIYDFHATALHLLGLDHKRLTYYHNGSQRRLTDVHGEVLRPVLG